MAIALESIQTSPSVQTALGVVFLSLLYYAFQYLNSSKVIKGYPVISLSDDGSSDAAADWRKDAKAVLYKGMQTGKPFQVLTLTGPILCLPNGFAHEIKNDHRFSFQGSLNKEFFTEYRGFEMFNNKINGDQVLLESIRTKLTQSLSLITNDLVEEADLATREVFPDSKDWNTIKIKQDMLQLVARLSARVFLGVPMCRNQEWLDISKNYTVDVFNAARRLRNVQPALRWLAQWWLPETTKVRREITDARRMIKSEVEIRKKRARESIAKGERVPKTADAIGWMVEVAEKRGVPDTDFGVCQVTLSVAAIHTTSETLTHCMIAVCQHPEIVKPLRDEIISVMKENGWSKITLYKLKLVDSFLKETQRLTPPRYSTMARLVEEKVELSDGTVIPPDTQTLILPRFMDDSVYPEPEEFKVDRFLKKRQQPGQENGWQMATASPEHLAFGLGMHACPGRFFVTNELKVAFVFMLLRYDWELANDDMMVLETESQNVVLSGAELKYRNREPELDLVALMEASPQF